METVAQILVVLFGGWLVSVGILMAADPRRAIRWLSKAASTNFINYLEITLRGFGGAALVLYAEFSKFPQVFRVFGLFVVITSAPLLFTPRQWHARYAVWWSNRLTAPFVRMLAPLSLAFGGFLVYAVI